MILVIIGSHKCKINPDNIATPIAASLGDLTTLGILASIGGFLFKIIGKNMIILQNSYRKTRTFFR
jgi:solute carrier family 41